ncbi:MAG: type III ribulose-bisphosphate carboxylase [Candidatus Pacearchaeota archaeon]
MVKKELKFVDLKYHPKDDIVCLFRITPNKMSMEEAANTVALESSVGTWTEVKEQDYVKKLRARVFEIKKDYIKVAYPSGLFEPENIPNILSSIAGNIFGMKTVKSIRLEDVSFPNSILKHHKGPKYGIKGIREMMDVQKRPLIGTIIKPKLGLNTEHHSKSAYESWIGGCDIVKDDENLSSQRFNKFEKRLSKTLQMADKAESETGEKKAYLVNITAETREMIKRAQLAEAQGSKYIMIDILTSGWSAVQTIRECKFKMAIHAHRAMHAAFTRNKTQGISMMAIADFARLAGVDQLHIGTGIGKLDGDIKEIKSLAEEIKGKDIKSTNKRLKQNWSNINSVLPVSSGGLHPGHIPFLVRNLGKDLVIQAGGGIHGHPDGTKAGAIAARQAIDAVMQNISLRTYAKNHEELRKALEKWS